MAERNGSLRPAIWGAEYSIRPSAVFSRPGRYPFRLDLFCDVTPVWSRTHAFCGKPWVWCALQNFGDCIFLGGALNRIHADLPAARRDPLGRNLSGLGFVNEGLDYNPVVFDFLFEQAWRPEEVQLEAWLRDYACRAYGARDANAEAAWAILEETVYAARAQVIGATTAVPSFKPKGTLSYDNERLAQAWKLLLDASDKAQQSDAYRFDLVSVTRQVLDNYSTDVQREIVKAWEAKDRRALRDASGGFRELIRDLDALLATRTEFLLGTWLETAKRWGATPDERARLEWNARRVITMWGERTNIRDYSRRSWSGMLTGFYGKRWDKFLTALDQALGTGAPFDEAAFDRGLQDWERSWAYQRETYPTHSHGDSLKVSRRLWKKYHRVLIKPSGGAPSGSATGHPTK